MAFYPKADLSVKGTNSGTYTGGPSKGVWERLISKSVWNGACLIYTGSPSTKYGRTSIGRSRPNLYVHRVSWELIHGSIPQGFDVCHTCDNPRCFYPPHLFIGTRSENMQDCKKKGRWNKNSRGSKGMNNGRAVLTDEQVNELRILRDSGWTHRELSSYFNIGETQVGRLVRKEQRA